MNTFKFSGKVNARETVGGISERAKTVLSASGTARSSMPMIFVNSGPEGEVVIGPTGESNVYRDHDVMQLPRGNQDPHYVNGFTAITGNAGLAGTIKERIEQSTTENRGALFHFSDLKPLAAVQDQLKQMGVRAFEPVTTKEALDQRISEGQKNFIVDRNTESKAIDALNKLIAPNQLIILTIPRMAMQNSIEGDANNYIADAQNWPTETLSQAIHRTKRSATAQGVKEVLFDQAGAQKIIEFIHANKNMFEQLASNLAAPDDATDRLRKGLSYFEDLQGFIKDFDGKFYDAGTHVRKADTALKPDEELKFATDFLQILHPAL
jgi:hypothetical protein